MVKRKLIGLIGLALLPLAMNAQLYQNAENSTAVVLRDPARQASTEIDAVIYNPAGTAFLDDGWHFSVNGNAAFQTIKSNVVGSAAWEKNKIHSIHPSVQVAYKKGKWTLSASWANEGGYGKWKNKDGAGMMIDAVVSAGLVGSEMDELNSTFQSSTGLLFLTNELYKASGFESALDVDLNDKLLIKSSNLSSDLYNFTTRVGASYKITENLSVYLGARFNHVSHKNGMDYGLYVSRPASESSAAKEWTYQNYCTDIATATQNLAVTAPTDELRKAWADVSNNYSKQADIKTSGYNLESTRMNGIGLVPVIGIDYHWDKVNVAAKYEFQSHVYTSEGYSSFNIPANLSLGVKWQVFETLKLAAGGTLHFKTDDVYGMNFFNVPKQTAGSVSGSVTWKPIKRLEVSAGETYVSTGELINVGISDFRVNRAYRWRTSVGFGYFFTESLQLNAGFNFDCPHLKNTLRYCLNNSLLYISDLGGRKYQFAIGLNYKL